MTRSRGCSAGLLLGNVALAQATMKGDVRSS
jgi:hypothetical protein